MKILLVDDESQVLRGVSRIIGCEEDTWEIETAESGEDALDLLAGDSFDVVVSDMQMPGMDGAQLLEEVGSRYPRILRVILSGQADRNTVLQAVKPMHQYLSKPCDPTLLIEVIKRAGIFQETITSAKVLDAIGRANCLPSLPETVMQINVEVESEFGNSQSLAKVVSQDPILCARVLQLSNSSIFALQHKVVGVEQAVSMVGVDMIRSMAMSQAVYGENQPHDSILSARSLFAHSFEVAVAAKKLAKLTHSDNELANLIFSAGLLHDVGKLLLLNAFPDEYRTVVDEARARNLRFSEIEMEIFGATHQGVGGYLLGLWGLPWEVIEAVASHHSIDACAKANSACQAVFAANWIVGQRSKLELDRLVEASPEPATARAFADQISQWQEYIDADKRTDPDDK